MEKQAFLKFWRVELEVNTLNYSFFLPERAPTLWRADSYFWTVDLARKSFFLENQFSAHPDDGLFHGSETYLNARIEGTEILL